MSPNLDGAQAKRLDISPVLSPEDISALRARNWEKLKLAKYRHQQTALTFFIPEEVFNDLVDRKYPRVIESHYFPKKLCKPLLTFLGIADLVSNAESYTTARIRSVSTPLITPKFYLEFKGPKKPTPKGGIARPETDSFDIAGETFKALREWATAGSLVVDRYEITGRVTPRRLGEQITAHVDRIVQAGHPLKPVREYFTKVDFEPPSLSHLEAIRDGRHSFDFLTGCIEITGESRRLQRALSATRIAKDGLSKDTLKAMRTLEEKLKERAKKG